MPNPEREEIKIMGAGFSAEIEANFILFKVRRKMHRSVIRYIIRVSKSKHDLLTTSAEQSLAVFCLMSPSRVCAST